MMINQPPLTHKANPSNVFLYLSVVFTMIQLVTRPSPEMLKVIEVNIVSFAGISLLLKDLTQSKLYRKRRQDINWEAQTKRKERS